MTAKEIRLVFDPNLTREIMPSITAQVKERQVKGLPEELVKDYSVAFFLAGNEVFSRKITGNYQRLNVLALPEKTAADELVVTVQATHGYPSARIFEVRLY